MIAIPVDAEVYDKQHATVTAHHEAGHAVIAMAFGIEVRRLSLEVCRVRPPRGSAGCWGQAVTALSGPYAEMMFSSYSTGRVAELWSSAWKTDRSNALEHLLRLLPGPYACRCRALGRTHGRPVLAAIIRVAEALLDQGAALL
jgi:hypothetical protein